MWEPGGLDIPGISILVDRAGFVAFRFSSFFKGNVFAGSYQSINYTFVQLFRLCASAVMASSEAVPIAQTEEFSGEEHTWCREHTRGLLSKAMGVLVLLAGFLLAARLWWWGDSRFFSRSEHFQTRVHARGLDFPSIVVTVRR